MAQRKDLSDWVIHFVHRRNPDNDPLTQWWEEDSLRYPITFTGEEEPVFTHWPEHDETDALAPDASAYSVLKKIVDDGHIRAGWSFRGGKPTIYGPRAAVCFTDMPLYALVDYAKARADERSVQTYGIALPKTELFRAGGRPVIYGLSDDHDEIPRADRGRWERPRLLSPSCGIAPHEQYRYVAMSLGGQRRIDWSHEREWRWTKNFTEDDVPGLEIWAEEAYPFSEVVLIVQKEEEAKQLLDQLKTYQDRPYNRVSFEMSWRAISRTKVLALDMVEDRFRSDPMTRIEDLPALSLREVRKPTPSKETVRRVRAAVEKARAAAQKIVADRSEGGLFGFAWVMTYDSQSEVTQALVDLGFVNVFGGRGYQVKEVMEDVHSSMIDTLEEAARAAADILTAELGQGFYVNSMLD